MYRKKKIACVIPARLASTRFPKKMLSELSGKPLLQWVWEAAIGCPHFDERLFAVDSEQVKDLVEGFGAKAVMTSIDCQSGTDRLIEVQQNLDADIWVNWQGDEPFIKTGMIEDLLQSCDDETQDVWTLKCLLKENFSDPAIVKVVSDRTGRALYFSRSQIPHGEDAVVYKHVGLYAYTDSALKRISHLEQTSLEKSESLEQLRFLESGLYIQVHETKQSTVGIDLPEHLAHAEQLLRLTPGFVNS